MINALEEKLEKRKAANAYRQLAVKKTMVDFSSNDYLGLALSEKLKDRISLELDNHKSYKNGSTGSRLLTGNTDYAEGLEDYIAQFHESEAALIFNSGYDANLGLFSCIASRNDTIIYDELCHASIIDGIRLSFANSFRFNHNNLADLEQKLQKAKGNIYVALESVYSMDGDFASVEDIDLLCKSYGANMIVDEAHAVGIFGLEGKGRATESSAFARVITFGKAIGAHGAAIVGSEGLRNYLINYARSFIYTTALPIHSLVSVKCSYEMMRQMDEERKMLLDLITYFQNKSNGSNFLKSFSAIQGLIVPGNFQARAIAVRLQENGFDVRSVLSPTVPEGEERIRICLHSFNTKEQIDQLISCMQQ